MTSEELAAGIEEQAGTIAWSVCAWQDFGFRVPPAPGCKPIPPLGERSAEAIRAGHRAVEDIDALTRRLYRLREQLVTELRQNQDALIARTGGLPERPADGAS